MRSKLVMWVAVAAVWTASSSMLEAGLWNHVARKLGLGWSDGYHARPYRPYGHRHWHQGRHGYHVPYSGGVWVSPYVVPQPYMTPRTYSVPHYGGGWEATPVRPVPEPVETLPMSPDSSPSIPTPTR